MTIPVFALGFLGPILTFGMWLAEQFRDQHHRAETHSPTVSFVIQVPDKYRQRADEFRIETDMVIIPPSESGYTYRLIKEDGGMLWPTTVRVWTPTSGYEIEKVELREGNHVVDKIEGKRLKAMKYFDLQLPDSVGNARGSPDHFEVVFYLPDDEEERVSCSFSVLALTIYDWYLQYDELQNQRIGRRMAETPRQLHPERTETVTVIVETETGLTVIDTVGVNPQDRAAIAFSEKVQPGVYRIRVKPGAVRIGLDRPGVATPPPIQDGFYAVAPGSQTQITLKGR
ncbi:hypothetical protein HYW32_03410 [Candidatus Berkelbacteria bacterium]|nr:hypothetical protein [Candidatus Berkelbacteria bacterium]